MAKVIDLTRTAPLPRPSMSGGPLATPVADLPDPLAPDDGDDEIVLTTRRAIGRVAFVAAETAARFQRESLTCDYMAWMFSPRAVFDGRTAIDACLARDDCERGVILHGLGLGLDVDRASVDCLLADDDGIGGFRGSRNGAANGRYHSRSDSRRSSTRWRLYTATIAHTRDNRMVQAFHASIARNAREVWSRLADEFGPLLADEADIRVGLHPAAPLVIALVPPAVAEVIDRVGRDGQSIATRHFSVTIQQCIRA